MVHGKFDNQEYRPRLLTRILPTDARPRELRLDRPGLAMPERVPFCLASGTDWQKAGVAHATAQQMMIRGLVDREGARAFELNDQGRAVLEALLEER
jgi:hypothetical protein